MYSAGAYEVLFPKPWDQQTIEDLGHAGVERYRTKTIKAGDNLECEIYPIWCTQKQATEAKQLREKSREAQRNLNDRNAKKKIVRLINANFTADDICLTLSYRGAAPNLEQAKRDMQNFIRRIKTARKKLGLPPLKYVYVIEYEEDESRKKRVHHHIIMSGMDRDVAEQCWEKGWANSRRLQPDRFGLEALARYMVKAPRGARRWCCSKNLKKPVETVADRKISRRKVERIAADLEAVAPEVFEKAYPGYALLDVEIKHSDYVAGAYIYARMRKRSAPAGKGGMNGKASRASDAIGKRGAAMFVQMGGLSERGLS